jgi:hypothetical protein
VSPTNGLEDDIQDLLYVELRGGQMRGRHARIHASNPREHKPEERR